MCIRFVAVQNNLPPPSTCKRPCLSAYGPSDIDLSAEGWRWDERMIVSFGTGRREDGRITATVVDEGVTTEGGECGG